MTIHSPDGQEAILQNSQNDKKKKNQMPLLDLLNKLGIDRLYIACNWEKVTGTYACN